MWMSGITNYSSASNIGMDCGSYAAAVDAASLALTLSFADSQPPFLFWWCALHRKKLLHLGCEYKCKPSCCSFMLFPLLAALLLCYSCGGDDHHHKGLDSQFILFTSQQPLLMLPGLVERRVVHIFSPSPQQLLTFFLSLSQ